MWCRISRVFVRCLGKGVGQKTSLSAGGRPDYYQQRLGRCQRIKLQKFALGENYSGNWASSFRGFSKCQRGRSLFCPCKFQLKEKCHHSNVTRFKERGKRMALSNLALFGGAFFTPVIVGKITHTIGWQWSFYLIAIFSAALLPLVIFFVPETAYRRNSSLNTDYVVEESFSRRASEKRTSASVSQPDSINNHSGERDNRRVNSQVHDAIIPPKVSFAKSLLPFNGRKTDENFFKLVLRPLPLFFHPAVFWACLIQGALIGWTVMIGIVLAAIFLGPPLWFDEVKTGYMYTGPFIGAILGFLVAGLLSDWSTKLLIRRNRGVYEPEFRILLVVPQLIFGCAGLYGFGITSNHVTSWFWPDFFFALEVMGMVLGAVASALYIVDAHRKLTCPNTCIRRAVLTEFCRRHCC